MTNVATMNTQAGPIKICTVFDFIREAKREMLPKHYEDIAVAQKEFYSSANHFKYGFRPDARVIAETRHTLKLNPMKLLTELKKTTTTLYRESKNLTLEDLIYGVVSVSMHESGQPTHFFCIGEDLYCLVSVEDVVLFLTADYHQQLVCTRPNRNFNIYAPHLRVEF
jgi:hypothetical protein